MRRNLQLKAWILLLLFLTEIFSPAHLMALGSGPSQPEMAAFTPAGTTEMVDPFTGDFSYNIPLMDVEGYPINIAYNSGVTMEQEASWVGLGWNLNVGTINRSVRGLPDDFKGEGLTTTTYIKPMEIVKVGLGAGYEFFGIKKKEKRDPDKPTDTLNMFTLNASANLSFVWNNYKGFGLDFGGSMGPAKSGKLSVSPKVNFNLSSLDGTSAGGSLSARYSHTTKKGSSFAFGGSAGTGYNTRTGQTIRSLGTTAGYTNGKKIESGKAIVIGAEASATFIPIGLETYSPYPSVEMESSTITFSTSVGGEIKGNNANANISGSKTTQSVKTENPANPDYKFTKGAYGYLYGEHSTYNDLKDFNRDKQVQLNKTTPNLSPTAYTYDVFSVSGQGVGGTFRPFRNDIGMLSDPIIGDDPPELDGLDNGLELGFGTDFKIGLNTSWTKLISRYSPWLGGAHSAYPFKGKELNSTFENVYFKAAGELTQLDKEHYHTNIGGTAPLAFSLNQMNTESPTLYSDGVPYTVSLDHNRKERRPRAKHFMVHTAEEMTKRNQDLIQYYTGNGFYDGGQNLVEYNRVNADENTADIEEAYRRAPHHISEIVQTSSNGERYVYGIPAYNYAKEEVVYNTLAKVPDADFGRVQHKTTEDKTENGIGQDYYYKRTQTPSYAHSFLLTEKQSADYQDVTGDGVTADDPGSAWKFNYTKKTSDYRWRVPYQNSTFMIGFLSHEDDQKASYSKGRKELWYVHSVESKNQVAEFTVSERDDALGASDNPAGGKPTWAGDITAQSSYKLDKIVLYNKYDRLTNGADATPIKTVEFNYSYELCKEVENQKVQGEGKLTLKSIEISYGGNDQGKLSPYVFEYSSENPNYNPLHVDRWGNYKPVIANPGGVGTELPNEDFPYATQNKTNADLWASAWHLTSIITPSNAKIEVTYESDTYAYVQDRPAMQMTPVIAAGSNKIFFNGDELYNKNFLFITPPSYIPSTASDEEVKKLLFGGEEELKDMYFRFKTNNTTGDEYVAGYADAIDAGWADPSDPLNPNEPRRIFIQLKEVSPNAITMAAWGYFRENLFDKLYKQPANYGGTPDPQALIKGFKANIADIKQTFIGVENYLEEKDIAKTFVQSESFIRLYNPRQKFGGGARVASISLNDQWDKMAANDGANDDFATYGQRYHYEHLDELEGYQSYGVASYEPLIGNDENPWRTPAPYVSKASQGSIPAIDAYQEMPLGETFFPPSVVGYSKVVVTNINSNLGKTARAVTEHKFYTAKDFPVQVHKTEIDIYDDPSRNPALVSIPFGKQVNRSKFSATQGFSIVLNDMHGKPLSTKSISAHGLELGGTIYNYHEIQTPKGRLPHNQVQLINTEGELEEEGLVGVDYDLAIDSRSSYESSSTTTMQANNDFLIVPPIPFGIPTIYWSTVKDIQEVKTVTLTKVIQLYGVVESVTNFTDQYSTTAYNKVYDGRTGQVLLTEVKDEHKANEFQFNVPAYLTPNLQRMGPAYENTAYETEIVEETISICSGDGYYRHNGNLKHGDEVLITAADGSTQIAWVDLDFPMPDPTTTSPNGKDPYFKTSANSCDDYWEAVFLNFNELPAGSNDVNNFGTADLFCDKYLDPSYSPDFKFSELSTNIVTDNSIADVQLFLPQEGVYDFFMDPYTNFNFCDLFLSNNIYTIKGDALVPPFNAINEPFDIRNGFAATDVSGVPNPFINSRLVHDFDMDAGEAIQAELTELFEIKSYPEIDDQAIPISGVSLKFRAQEIEEHPAFKAALHNPKDGRPFNISMPVLLKLKMEDIRSTNEPKPLVDVYFIFSYQEGRTHVVNSLDNEDYTISNPMNNRVEANNANSSTPSCPNTYRLLKRQNGHTGSYLTDLNEGDVLKIIRSGNRNLLNANEGSVLANNNPMVLQDDRLLGLQADANTEPTTENILQVAAQQFSDDYLLQYPYTHSVSFDYNKFLKSSDGNFKTKKTYRYISPRVQTTKSVLQNGIPQKLADVNTPTDGSLDQLPTLWYREAGECNYILNSPVEQATSGWFTQEEITQFNEEGASMEAQNNELGIYSSILFTNNNRPRAVASNSRKDNLLVEDFEDYQYLSPSGIIRENHMAFFATTPNTTGVAGFSTNDVSTVDQARFVEGIAHTGTNSIGLKGENPGNAQVNLDYQEVPLTTLIEEQIGAIINPTANNKTLTLSNSDYNNQRTAFENELKQQLPTAIAAEVDDVLINGSNTFTKTITDYLPAPGQYFYSLWMKDMAASNQAYQGVSPNFEIVMDNDADRNNAYPTTITVNKAEKAIDGWYLINGEFTIEEDATEMDITFDGGLWGAFFDDLRIHPVESKMQTYIYQPLTGRLAAQLDENNYATFYDYNEEGIPVQVRRETDAGVLTISESQQSRHHHPISQ